ncbi:MAG: hypothetical protein HZB46_10460 [Solirubrobacterales bacterium]|nr:hypothetical protein [Solirubrobacterales bacterium]
MPARTPLLAALAALLLTPAAALAADPVPGATYEGTTESGSPFSFKVAPDGAAITDILSSTALTCVGPDGGVEIAALASKTPIPVTGGTIAGNDDDALPRLEVSGTFASAGEASGKVIARMSKFSIFSGLTSCMKEFAWTAKTAAAAPATPAVPAITLGAAPKGTVAKGFTFAGSVAAPAKVTAVAKLGAAGAKRYRVARTFARAATTATGAFALKLKPSAATARKLRKARKLVVTVTVAAVPTAGGAAQTATRKVTLQR